VTIAALVCVLFAAGQVETKKADAPAPVDESKLTPAERLSRLQRTIETEQTQLRELTATLENPASEYTRAETEFHRLDSDVDKLKADIKRFRDQKQPEPADALEKDLPALAEKRRLAGERFNVAFDERKAVREKIATLQERIRRLREQYDTLAGFTPAEKISRLEKSIETGEAELKRRLAELAAGAAAFLKVEAELKGLDTELADKARALAKFKDDKAVEKAAEIEKEIAAATARRLPVKERFDKVDGERSAVRRAIAALEAQVSQDKTQLASLRAATAPAPETKAAKTEPPPDGSNPATKKAPDPPPAPVAGTLPGLPGLPTPNGPLTVEPRTRDEAAEAEVRELQQEIAGKRELLKRAQRQVKEAAQRVGEVDRLVEQETRLLDAARRKADLAAAARRELDDELRRMISAGAPAPDLLAVWNRISDNEQRHRDAHVSVTKSQDEIARFNTERVSLYAQQIKVEREADRLAAELREIQDRIEKLENPSIYRRTWLWLVGRGPTVLFIVVVVWVLRWASRRGAARVVEFLTRNPDGNDGRERDNRTKTLVEVAKGAVSMTVLLIGVVLVLNEIGINVTVLAGGAAVIGLAVAFGAQNLIRDYFSGFIILIENQYTVNDVVKIGTVSGMVERVTLRMTVLRDIDGTVHFIPNGQIASVSNMTCEWSRALFDVAVAYKDNVDLAIETVRELGAALRKDLRCGPLILDDLEMLGVEALGDNGVILRFFIKTRPVHQWTVKREMLRRIKNRFDELGIELPVRQNKMLFEAGGIKPLPPRAVAPEPTPAPPDDDDDDGRPASGRK